MKKIIYLLSLLLFSFWGMAQQSSIYSQAAEEFSLRNPAGLSIDEMRFQGNIFNFYLRNQWWGNSISGAPKTQTLNWTNNLHPRNLVGATLFADNIGETQHFGINGRYARSLAEGLRIGLRAGLHSQRIKISNLDIYDPEDTALLEAGNTRWSLLTNLGIFYFLYDRNKDLNWFAGAAYKQSFQLNNSSGEAQNISGQAMILQGGIGWRSIWTGARIRLSFDDISALDIYLRKYFLAEQFFLGGNLSTDQKNTTAGVQLGYERLLNSAGINTNHYLIFSIGLSKPLSNYMIGNNIIFDARISWILGKEGKGKTNVLF